MSTTDNRLETLRWHGQLPGKLEIIDQRQLPVTHTTLVLETVQGTWDAIKTLAVRGAPAIGVAAAYGVVIGAQQALEQDAAAVQQAASEAAEHLATSRPTAVNLFWALERMQQVIAAGGDSGQALAHKLLAEAREIHEEDRRVCRTLGKLGAELLPNEPQVMTHCNAGGLATAEFGTAVGCIYAAAEAGKNPTVLACETRPLLQGARLTSFELKANGIPVTIMADSMGAFAMQRGKVDAVIVGADRVARNGDAANKIGTYAHAVAAKRHGLPFYVAAPTSTFDLELASGGEIPIEERAREELTHFNGKAIAPDGVGVWNPAFDVTPADLITAIVTERGVIQPVTEENVLKVVQG